MAGLGGMFPGLGGLSAARLQYFDSLPGNTDPTLAACLQQGQALTNAETQMAMMMLLQGLMQNGGQGAANGAQGLGGASPSGSASSGGAASASAGPNGASASTGGSSASASSGGACAVTGDHQQLISQALQMAGQPTTPQNIQAVNTIVEHESSWNPSCTNNTDSNAKAGHPSTGLMQTIPSTFQQYAIPGHNSDIHDPLSNLIAGIRYAVSRYGSLENVPGVKALAEGKSYVGY